MKPSLSDWRRIWKYIDQDGPGGCWLWTGCKNERGYGLTNVGRVKNQRVHRLVYQLRHGPLPSTVFCLHKCDVRNCVNPDHIFLGSYKENGADMKAKGRSTRGTKNSRAKLTEDDVRELRRLREEGWTAKRLSQRFGVALSTCVEIWRRVRWAHVD